MRNVGRHLNLLTLLVRGLNFADAVYQVLSPSESAKLRVWANIIILTLENMSAISVKGYLIYPISYVSKIV